MDPNVTDVFLGTPPQQPNHESHTWHVYAKNGRINSGERRIILLSELSLLQWHFICFSETRCLTDDVILHGGHRLITSLETKKASGVGILVHSDYIKYNTKKQIISDRIMGIDVKIGGKRVRVISVYMPHAGYSWSDFEECIEDITILTSEATRLNMNIIIGGDFNLSLGIGRRGTSMTDFCHQFRLAVANGSGFHTADDMWTFRSSLGTLRRIDYILYNPGLYCDTVVATWELDLGSDHRSVKASFSFMPGYKKEKKQIGIKRGWKPILNEDGIAHEFHENIDAQVLCDGGNTLNDLQSMLRDAAPITKSNDEVPGSARPKKSIELKTLIYQRRHCRINLERKRLSKAIFKLARQELRTWRTMWADCLLTKFRNTKHLQKINIDPIQSQACPIDDADFAEFLEQLFEAPPEDIERAWNYPLVSIPLFVMGDLDKALSQLSNLRCCDEDGITAEMIKYNSDGMKAAILTNFNSALHSGEFADNWHHIIFRMLPKDGDTTQLKNWRPIAILPIMYKLFARLLYNRISPTLFSWQSADQHAFTPGKRIEDALLHAEIIIEHSLEFNVPLWLLSMDLRKAFDTVSHEHLLLALGYHGLDPAYIALLQRLYKNKSGAVNESRHFKILRGVKQGDVLSAIIFNCVLDIAFENWEVQLNDEGIYIGDLRKRLTNTKYADDVLLYAKSLEELQRMTELLIGELRKVGLHLNADKTKILHSSIYDVGSDRDYVDINGEFVHVLHEEKSHRYLGRHVSLSPEYRLRVELQNRKRHAWASFHKHKKVILNRHVSVAKRFRFFDICVTPSILYALVSLPLTRGHVGELDVLQRKMLRRIIGWRRVEGEAWDVTMHRMQDRMDYARSHFYHWQIWSYRFFRDQFRFAIHSINQSRSQCMLLYNCSPFLDVRGEYVPHRDVGRPCMKWDDYLKAFFLQHFPNRRSEHWSQILRTVDHALLEQHFVNFSMGA